jgi:hypothetical protein
MKFVKESLYEKFTEEDTDPIHDMGIGLKAQLEKLLNKDPFLKWNHSEEKDIMRIKSIISKSKGNSEKEQMYARNMAKAIEDRRKAYRRYLAAKEEGGEGWEVTNIFLQKVLEMYGII